jgi:hypothetical protein
MAQGTNHIFLPCVQPGIAASIPDQAVERLAVDQPAVITLPLALVVNSDTVQKTARVYGPGDVMGIDPQQVVRLEPRHFTTDFEPNHFPAIEFDRPDFPWLFTPAKAGDQGRLRPWLCLIAVRKQDGVEFRPAGSNRPLPAVAIGLPAKPADELPDLSESYLWAHAQVTGADRSQLQVTLEGDPARSISRLLCPRRLQPLTSYLACVVPAFEIGRKAGLNLPIATVDEQNLAPAWLSGDQAPSNVLLPVYYTWEFRTGEGGDFEDLVRRLEPRVIPPEAGKRPMDIRQPGFTIQPQPKDGDPGTVLGLEGAIRAVDSEEDPWPDTVRIPFQAALQDILNTPSQVASGAGANRDPIVAPPIYGRWQAAARELNASAPAWLNGLNLDPRHRVMAAMGTEVVQNQQEQLMASAWEQLGSIEQVNHRLRQAQLSRAVNDKYYSKTFSRFPDETFVRIVAPAKSRVALTSLPNQPAGAMLFSQKLATSTVPASAISSPLRKIARPRGALNRQYAEAGMPRTRSTFTFYATGVTAFVIGSANRGAVTIDAVTTATAGLLASPIAGQGQFIWNPDPVGHWERPRVQFMKMLDAFRLAKLSSGDIAVAQVPPTLTHDFQEAAGKLHAFLAFIFRTLSPGTSPQAMTAADFKTSLLASLNPSTAVSNAVHASLSIGSPSNAAGDDLEPIMDAPSFPQPMYEALRDISQDYLFPGLEHVPPNTVQLLKSNAKFIESFMVGLNAEMGRELLWRGYPTDQRGTYFQHFWDTAGAESHADIPPVDQWGNHALGDTAVGSGADKLILLIRGELLRRYPGTAIYAVKAVRDGSGSRTLSPKPEDEYHPIFRGSMDPDVMFLGFNLTRADVTAGDGAYFILQEQPSEPRFGLDDDPAIPTLKTWNDLNWGHLAPNDDSYVAVKKSALVPVDAGQAAKAKWGRNSAHMAYITKQLPSRVAIHASELLP